MSIKSNKINYSTIIVVILLIILVCGIVYTVCNQNGNDNLHSVSSDIDHRSYAIRNNGTEFFKKQAANRLALIRKRVDDLVDYMVMKNIPTKETAERLQYRWKKCELNETGENESSAAYTVNKGEEMRLCVRNTQTNTLEELNTSMFVILHELGHLMSVTYGHNDEFKENFSLITHLASALGYYKPELFDNKPVDYCGTTINTTPCWGGTCDYTSIPSIKPIAVEGFAPF